MSYEILPEGDYVGCVLSQASDRASASIVFGESTKKQTPYASVKLGITEGEFTGRWIFWTGYLTEKTIVKTVKALHAMGFKGNRLTAFLEQQPDTTVTFGVAHEEYEGKVRARVKWVGATAVPLEPKKLDELSDQFEALAIAEEPNGVLTGEDPLPDFFQPAPATEPKSKGKVPF